ncbi:MAG: DUF3109 family protein [Ignavibacterium sp.]|uniref:DUF3109 family protein n=1 Tax=Ignavibacterium sp. TaxID=2651167 RepID=UPI00404988A7
MFFGKIIGIDDVLVREEVLTTPFACDLKKCKGACCTLDSEFGAPVTEDEIDQIKQILPIVKEYITEEHKDEIEQNGFFEKKYDELLLRSINNKACVFVYYDGDIAKCAIEKAYFDGKVKFRKPISCHLFPIRVAKFGGDILRYEKFVECNPAIENGKKLNITIAEFCKDSLIRLYGEKWYSQLMEKSGR